MYVPETTASSSPTQSNGSPTPVSAGSSATSTAPGEAQSPPQEASVITGMAFRFPGAKTLSSLWDNVVGQKDLQKKMPEDRFKVDNFYHPQGTNKGTTNAKYGYFLDDPISEFDNEFFRISRQEAESMDPQQRILLEVVFEALEDAGIPIQSLRKSQTSVYVGSFTNDYNSMTTKDLTTYPKYTVTGTGNAILANRISYFYDLNGPSMTIDTACSSSLVCFHLGNQSLIHGESDISIVAGSALHFDPNIFITMTDFGMLSEDGRCRTFDKQGSGYVRGEGVCAMILKRQSTAEEAGDRIRAIVRGTGSNHDGSKSGLTLPNGAAQARLIRQTYKDSGLETNDTDYFEAHGTGTKAGDPIESSAIGSVFAPGRDKPLYVGSIKSNLGHLEGASGLAGIAKAVMSVSSGKILPNMHFNKPNPQIDFDFLKIKVPTELIDWPTNRGFRRASVNSFGYGGSNAHVVLENYSPRRQTALGSLSLAAGDILTDEVKSRPYLLPLMAHNEGAANNNVRDISHFIANNDELTSEDLALSYSVRRSRLQLCSAAVGSSRESLLADLANPKSWTTQVSDAPRLGFVFTGQGAQWYAMGRELLEKSPLFRQTIEKCDRILSGLPDRPEWTCLEELQKPKEDTRLGESLLSQPLCCALQLAIIDQLAAWNIAPAAVVGHSSGEIAAAYAAGILSFRNAIVCAYYRGLYMSQGKNSFTKGAMIAVGMTEPEGKELLQPYQGRIGIAAVNSATSLTLSGDEDAVDEVKIELDGKGVFNRKLRVEQAFHSHHMVPLAPAFDNALSSTQGFQPMAAQTPMFSSVTARDSSARPMDSSYWAANMTGVVRFSDALTGTLLTEDEKPRVDILVEIGPHPALKGPAKDVVKSLGLELPYVSSLRRDLPAFESLLRCAGELLGYGYQVDMTSVNSHHWLDRTTGALQRFTPGVRLTELPAYSWNHGEFWAETRAIRQHRQRSFKHSLLGAIVPGCLDSRPLWRNYLRLSEIPWLAGHCVQGKVIFPAAGYITMALEAVSAIRPTLSGLQLRDVVFKNALVLDDKEAGTEVLLELQPLATSAKNTSSTWYLFSITSVGASKSMIEHCRGQVRAAVDSSDVASAVSAEYVYEAQKSTHSRTPVQLYYKQLRSVGLDYGEDFRLLRGNVDNGRDSSIGAISFTPNNVICEADECIIHPTVLDSAFHVIFAAIEGCTEKALSESFVPTFIRHANFSSLLSQRKSLTTQQDFVVQCNTRISGPRVARNTLRILASEDEAVHDVLVELDGLEVTALGNESSSAEEKRLLFFNIEWNPLFSQLGASRLTSSSPSIPDLVRLFAHEVPDAALLHVTPELESAKHILAPLGGSNGQMRRFRKLNLYHTKSEQGDEDDIKALDSAWPGLVECSEPSAGRYDLIILEDKIDTAVNNLLNPGGYIITSGIAIAEDGLTSLFTSGDISIWQASKTWTESSTDPITVVLPIRLSDQTLSLLSAIRTQTPRHIETVTVGQSVPDTADVISLVSLDDDVLFDVDTEQMYLESVQALVRGPVSNVIWLTRGAAIGSLQPQQAVIGGLLRSIRSEHDDLRLVTLDLDPEAQYNGDYVSKRILQVLPTDFAEDEIADRKETLLVPRAQPDDKRNSKLPGVGNRQVVPAPFSQDSRNLALKIGKTGLLDTLSFEDDEDMQGELPADCLEVEVKASALNFRDVAAALGIIEDHRLGDEAAGIVVGVGKSVSDKDYRVGDRVIAFRPGQGAHRTRVRNPAVLCQKIGDMGFEEAAAFSLVTVTAYYSLYGVARLRRGEYCLVHAAAGGVGQMAVQLAQRVGAKVIATVGSPEKRAYIKDKFGVPDEMIFSSRDNSFVDGVMKVTSGKGCDVVLNSLAGDLLHDSWKCLAPLGRLIEIGKRDIHENTKLDMDPFRHNVTYASVDCITLFHVDPELLSEQLCKSFALLEKGEILPPGPIRTFNYGEAQQAFRALQLGKFFGKIVLAPQADELIPLLPVGFTKDNLFQADKIYLLVGGLGGIGRALSQWMFRKGARRIAFMSRSGDASSTAKETIAWLKERAVETIVFNADVAHKENVRSSIGSIKRELAGIFQAAMVLRDGPFDQMTIDDWKQCVRPKILGTTNLHEAVLDLDLDFFVCFSSMSSVIGSAGQSNYSAANCYLDALMSYRRSKGLAGATMNVGVVGDSGAVAEDEALAVILERMGYESITQSELFYQVQEAVVGSRSASDKNTVVDMHQIISGLNMRRKDVYWAQKPLFRNMYANRDLETSAAAKGTQSLTAMLKAAAGHEERIETLTAAFIQKVAAVMGTPAELIRATQPLTAYGLDSIVAVEFRKWFSNAVWLDVPLFDILGSKSIKDLIEKAASTLRLGDGEDQGSSESAPSDAAQGGPRKRGARKSSQKTIARRNLEHKPISSYQSRLWFQHNVSSDASTLNFVADFSLEGEPQLPVLQATLNEMALRNDILRTKYFEGDDFSEQATVSYFKAQIAFEDLSWEVDAQKTLATKTLSLRAKPIDVEEGESMNVCLFKMSNQKYRLVFSMHHINLDNGSTKPFIDQFTQIYDGISKQKDLQSIRGPRLSYSDFAVWHNEFLQGPTARSDLEWWQNNLKDIPEASMLLPFAHSKRFENRSAARRTLETAVPSNVLARLKRISAASGATPAHFVMAAFRAFIYRYTEHDDLVFLMVDGTRPHPEVSDVLGFFVNLIPLRLRMEADWDFHSVLSHVTDVSFNALAHNSTPFDTILETVGVKRSTAHFPISQVTVNYQVYGKPPVIKLADFDVVDINFRDIPTPADIALEAIEDPAVGLSLKLQYDPDLYADKESQRFLDNFSVFLTSAASDHRQPVSEINMCGLQELQHLRQKCWGLQVSPDKWAGKSIVSKILETAESLPAATAIETSDRETKTYSELVTMAKTIASDLQALGLSKGDLVGVMFKPGIEMIAVLLGVIMGGFGYLPLDPDFAVDRLAHMIEETQVAIVLVEKLLPGLDRSVARVAAMVPSFDPATVASWKPPENNLDDPFYVIYTSGSTGKPKGVLLTHGNTRAMLSSHNAIHDFSWNDRILFVTSFTWDVSVSQIWGALTSGATMLLAKEDVRKDPGALASFLRDAEVTVTYTTPTQYAAMLARGKEELANCSTHRTAIFAGEALSQRLVKEVYDHGAAGLTVYNEFGPSEATVQTTCYKASYPENIEGGVPIGSGLPNCSHYAIDPKMRPVPASAPGELCEGGPQVGAGYVARPEATREVYVEDSFASEAFRSQGWTRMYRTGDRVRFLDGGQLEYLGRISGDSQLKLRGFRIDLGEIENELISAASRFPEQLAADAVVVPLSVDEANDLADGVDDRQLVAFLVAKNTMKAPAIQTIVNEIHSYLKRRLNSYMLPSGYQIIDNFPTLPSGKRSRKLLAEVGLDLVMPVVKTESSESNQTPDGVEVMDIITKVLELFRVVLKLRPEHDINPSLSFFDLGGHSLLGLRLTSQIKKAFNTKLELREIVLDMTPINIGRVIAAKLGIATTAPITPSRTDWEKEASLPDEPAFYPRSDAASFCGSGSKGILLTGADSVTGSHLLGRLLAEDSSAPISIIGTSSKLAEGDVLKMLQDRGISVDRDTFTARVDCLPGNLTTPNFGLTSDAFVRLGQSTSVVLHFGSVVSLLQGVSDLRLPNIEATKDIVRLAALNPEAEIHYLSSWSVVHLQSWHSSQGRNGWDGQTLKHEKVQDHYVPTGEDFAYFKTRWAAEALLSQAAQRGIPTNIYRSSGLDESFTKTEDNFYLGMIKSMVDSGMIPQFEDNGFCIDLVTPQHIVDVVTRRLKADLVRQRAANVFHISSMGRLSLDNLPEILDRLGLKQELQLVPIETWLNKLEERGEVNASVTRAYIEAGHRMFSLHDRQTRAVLGSSADMQQTLVPSLQKLVG